MGWEIAQALEKNIKETFKGTGKRMENNKGENFSRTVQHERARGVWDNPFF